MPTPPTRWAGSRRSRYAYGAQFAEVRVDADTGEVRLNRMLGVFAAGRVVNPTTARSQLIGGMTMGLSMALHEEGLLDERYGDWVNHDLADVPHHRLRGRGVHRGGLARRARRRAEPGRREGHR